jgi:hypothetical protein
MTAEDFRNMALSFPEASEGSHMGHPDFRVRGKIFATIPYPGQDLGMVKLKPEQQATFIEANVEVFAPVKGGWGRKGATTVRLEAADAPTLHSALLTAWRNAAPKRLAEKFEELG